MYSIKAVLAQSPEKVSTAIVAALNVSVAAGWLDWTAETIAGMNTVLVLALGLFYVAPLTTSKAGLAQVQQATDDAHAAGVELGAKVAPVKRAAKKAG